MAMVDRLVDRNIGASQFLSGPARLPRRVEHLVVGGGIVGCSIAAHLAQRGAEVALLEANTLGSGTTWHAAGLVTGSRTTAVLTELAAYGVDTYATLQERTGIDVAFRRRGSLMVARTPGRITEMQYAYDVAKLKGIEASLLEPDEVTQMWPPANPDGILKALFIAGDGHVNPGHACVALAKLAHEAGATIKEEAPVLEVMVDGERVAGVRTSQGDVLAKTVTLAAGLWTRNLAVAAGVNVPLYPAEHIHVLTRKVPPGVGEPPVFRDLDNHYYIRGENGHLLVGAFEPDGVPHSFSDIPDTGFAEFPAAWDHFASIQAKAEAAVPLLAEVGFERFLNAPESFTPDNNFIIGEASEVQDLFVAAGFNSQGILFAPGVGREMAEWLLSGGPAFDASSVSVRRFSRHQSNQTYLRARTSESLGRLYSMHWPQFQPSTARNVRRSPLHHRVAALGACFGEANGWERANWYAEPGTTPTYDYSYDRPNWFVNTASEHHAARTGIAIFDLSSFSKLEVAGPEAASVLQRIVTADVDIPVNKAVYTLALNRKGGIEVDGIVLRLEWDRFWIITPAFSQDATFHLFHRQARSSAAAVVDVTSGWATIGVMGPQSRTLLASVTGDSWDNKFLPYAEGRPIEIGYGKGYALRLSFVGELGYEIYVPAEIAESTFDVLWEAGRDFDAKLAGYHALDTLRSEKGFRHLGFDIGPGDNPYTAGLGFAIGPYKDFAFTGGEALRRIDRSSLPEQTVYVRLNEPEPQLFHDEAVLVDDCCVGRMTSGAYGHTLGAAVGLARIHAVLSVRQDVAAEVVVAGRRVPAVLSSRPFYDPMGERFKR